MAKKRSKFVTDVLPFTKLKTYVVRMFVAIFFLCINNKRAV